MSKKRTTYSILNSSFAAVSHFVILLFSFITRTAFIKILGSEYLGFDALFSNILSVLSIVDLGVGTALNYSLYKPMYENDEMKVAAIIQYFRKIFYRMGIVLMLMALVITPFIGMLVKNIGSNLVYMQKIFILYGIMTFSSYFFVDCRTLYFSSQQNYKVLYFDLISKIITKTLQVILLLVYPSYLAYLVIEIMIGTSVNLFLKIKTKKDFNYVFKKKYELTRVDKKIIFNDVKYLSLGKLASVGIGSTDSLIISKFLGATVLGAYSNYFLIISSSSGVISSFTNGIIASLGDLFIENDLFKISRTFKLYNFITFQASSLYLILLLSIIQPFMFLWLNGEYLLDKYTIGIVVFNNAFIIMWNSLKNIIQTRGLFKKDMPIQLVQVLINLIISIFLVQKIGLSGVFLGTTISYLIAFLLQACLISNEVLKTNLIKLLAQQLMYGVIAFVQLFIIYTLVDVVFLQYSLINLILRGCFVVLLFVLTEFIFYWKNNDFRTCYHIVLRLLRKI